MYSRRIVAAIATVFLVLLTLFVVIPQPVRSAQFVLADWDFPVEYGQGIWKITVLENSTGDWIIVSSRFYNQSQTYDWNASIVIAFYIYTWLNSTLTGASGHEDGKNYQRVNVTVTTSILGSIETNTIFSQQNLTITFTREGEDNPYPNSMWLYTNSVILNFLPQSGHIYKIAITYEVYW